MAEKNACKVLPYPPSLIFEFQLLDKYFLIFLVLIQEMERLCSDKNTFTWTAKYNILGALVF